MGDTRIEILKDGIYIDLELGEDNQIRYNPVLNKIGDTKTRSISGSNTFSIPWIFQNINALGLNQFNTTQLAASLNQKYPAKYYNEDTLFQTGFILINNTNDGRINLNFIDEALDITEKWGSTNYKELLQSTLLLIPAIYQTAITEMRDYNMNKTAVLPHLTDVSGEGFPIALFPNNINQIGDKWQQQDVSGTIVRVADQFNPYQSRPIYNVKAFMTLACEAYGYTPIFHSSIDWSIVADTYMVTNGLDKSGYSDSGIINIPHAPISLSDAHWHQYSGMTIPLFYSQVAQRYESSSSIRPEDLPGYATTVWDGVLTTGAYSVLSVFTSNNTIFVPDVTAGNVGTLRFQSTALNRSVDTVNQGVWIIYEDTTITNGYISERAIESVNNASAYTLDITINKSQFDSPTDPNAGAVVGLYCLAYKFQSLDQDDQMTNMTITETASPVGIVSYDEYGQFLQDSVDLTYGASLETISSMMSGVMQKEGVLMNIDSLNKEIEFFSYSAYNTRRDSGEFVDWSKYLLEYNSPDFNTNFGNNYAISNQIGLSDPYPGNTSKIVLGNQTSSSKYKDFTTDLVSKFKDIKSVSEIANTVPVIEVSTSGRSLVEFDIATGNVTQVRYNTNTQGTLIGLPGILNINYAVIPTGVADWYSLIDNSVRAKPRFLLPLDEIKNLDLRKPIFIDQLGGYYIPELIEQYTNSYTEVRVKLIKLEPPIV
jgi:hypothetical protein